APPASLSSYLYTIPSPSADGRLFTFTLATVNHAGSSAIVSTPPTLLCSPASAPTIGTITQTSPNTLTIASLSVSHTGGCSLLTTYTASWSSVSPSISSSPFIVSLSGGVYTFTSTPL